ncbi:MAG: alpha/beta hydrolase [Proteobacteria bacterium]|nr:alpha/beta hydrolase [Pseudomonadota bacterium]
MERIQIKARGLTFDGWADGPEDGPLIICLHGLPRSSWEWHHQLPKLAEAGFRAVATDLRGYCPGARPEGVDSYFLREYADDTLAIADELGRGDRPFHLMGTSIGAVIAWRIAGENPQRVSTLACINIPHPGAFDEIVKTENAEDQKEKMRYITYSKKEGNERKMFNASIKIMELDASETDPYVEAHSSDEALRAVYHYYRANVPEPGGTSAINKTHPLKPVEMPTLYIWPPGAANVSRQTAEANANYAKGPYRFEVVEGARNFALQKQPERITQLLLEHLAEHAK